MPAAAEPPRPTCRAGAAGLSRRPLPGGGRGAGMRRQKWRGSFLAPGRLGGQHPPPPFAPGGFWKSPAFRGANDSAVARGAPGCRPSRPGGNFCSRSPRAPETPEPGCACGLACRPCLFPSWPVTRGKRQPFQFILNKHQENPVGRLTSRLLRYEFSLPSSSDAAVLSTAAP